MAYNPSDYFGKTVSKTNDVVVEVDPSKIVRRSSISKMTKIDIENYKRESNLSDSRIGATMEKGVNKLGGASSDSKSDRLFYLGNAISSGRVKNITEACAFVNVTPSTIRKYLTELGYKSDGLGVILK